VEREKMEFTAVFSCKPQETGRTERERKKQSRPRRYLNEKKASNLRVSSKAGRREKKKGRGFISIGKAKGQSSRE